MNNIVGTFVNVWLHPWDSMGRLRDEGEEASIKSSMVFVAVMMVLGGVFSTLWMLIHPQVNIPVSKPVAIAMTLLVVPALSFASSFLGALIVWGVTHGLLRGTGPQYKISYRLIALITAFSPVVALVAGIPGNIAANFTVGHLIGMIINIWGIVVMVQGIIIARDTPKVRTWITWGILIFISMIFTLYTQSAMQRQYGGGLPDLEGRLGGDEDFNLDEDTTGGADTNAPDSNAQPDTKSQSNVNKQLQDMVNKAKEDSKK